MTINIYGIAVFLLWLSIITAISLRAWINSIKNRGIINCIIHHLSQGCLVRVIEDKEE